MNDELKYDYGTLTYRGPRQWLLQAITSTIPHIERVVDGPLHEALAQVTTINNDPQDVFGWSIVAPFAYDAGHSSTLILRRPRREKK